MNIVYRDPQNYENEKQRSEKFWSENMIDEKSEKGVQSITNILIIVKKNYQNIGVKHITYY